ncbi:hypothetical protein FHW69_001470 [Luteibacter sp. Sphag1AF]|uniref:hypothetical protein n=1 Tax=Luteibacter sp. Sphag1AF TaxID=2587031 RepID=UPI0016178B40|nr:hypothetical protein [Luteibacter sp. Sphag1AF]MBB3226869.1 hypothetical protein [Luteibacter sp. Sphag1AF]
MAIRKPLPEAALLAQLLALREAGASEDDPGLPAMLVSRGDDGQWRPTEAVSLLVDFLKARDAALQAAFDTELAADELRRFQKFARPGQPSPHVVQMRQRQAAARQASNQARQAQLKNAAAFAHMAQLTGPARRGADEVVLDWVHTSGKA